MRFARLIEFKTGQLLISITTDSAVDGVVLSLETYHRGAFIRMGIPFSNFGDASESMDELSQDDVEQIYQDLLTEWTEVASPRIKPKEGTKVVEGFEQWVHDHPFGRYKHGSS